MESNFGEAMAVPERRRFSRIKFGVDSKLMLDGAHREIQCRIVDVSRNGLGIVAPLSFGSNSLCAVSFDISCRSVSRRINVTGLIVACSPENHNQYRAGVQIVDLDSGSKCLLECLVRHSCNISGCMKWD